MADLSSTVERARQTAPQAPGGWIEVLARAGYATKGVVFALIGVLAIRVAMGAGGRTEGSQGAIQTIGQQPFGQILLVLMAIGLVGYATWRFVQASLDTEQAGQDAKGIIKRIGFTISGLIYLFLAYSAASIVFGWRGGGSGGDTRQEWTAELLSRPFGPWLVGLAGVVIIGLGLHHFYRAYKASFMEQYKTSAMSARERTWARRLGQFGLSARGVVFGMIGGFLLQAAVQAQPSEAEGLSGALETLARQPSGPWLLGVVAAGLIAYGLYCFSRARYRYIQLK